MQQPPGLILNSFNDLRVAMPGGVDGNTGGKIKKDIAVHIMNPQTLRPVDNQRINPCVGGRYISLIHFDQFVGPGSGQ